MRMTRKLLSTSCLTAALIGVSAGAFANPQDGVVAAGNATINASGKKLDVVQTTDKAVIDWRGFDIAPDEHTQFNQPGSGSITLNRIHSNAASRIDGKLTANGNIVIVNQNGVMFGAGAKVDVNGLIATTADIDNDKFMADGPLKFNKPGNPNASIVNSGQITAKDAGLVGFVAPNVENFGVIQAKLGRVQLASGDTATVDLYGDGLMQVSVSDAVKSQLVSNTGVLNADGGKVALTAAAGKEIVNSLIRANGSLQAQTVGVQNGEIIIGAEGTTSSVEIMGVLDATGQKAGEHGGDITISARDVTLKQTSVLDASGQAGGGVVRVGGDYQGAALSASGLQLKNAQNLTVEHGAKINVSTKQKGNGGRVILWGDKKTSYHGNVEAKGGALGGAGGFVETSGKEELKLLDADGNLGLVDTSDAFGGAGYWLLDPTNITLYSRSGSGDGTNTFTSAQIEAMSAGANVTLIATNNITFDLNDDTLTLANNRNFTADAGNNLTSVSGGSIRTAGTGAILLTAGSDVDFTPELMAQGSGSITLRANRNVVRDSVSGIFTNGGDIVLNSDRDANGDGAIFLYGGGASATLHSSGGNIILGGGINPLTDYAAGNATYNYGVIIRNPDIQAAGGNITINGKGWASTACPVNLCQGVNLSENGSVSTTGLGNITFNAIGGGSGSGTLYSDGIDFYNITGGITAENGAITINSRITETGGNTPAIYIGASTTFRTTGVGDININILENGVADLGLWADGTTFISGGDISYIGNYLNPSTYNATFTATGDIIVRPYTAGTTVGIGNGVGALGITNDWLNTLTAGGTLWLGGYGNVGDVGYVNNAGDITVNYNGTIANNLHLVGNGDILFNQSGNTLTMASGKSLTSHASNNVLSSSNGNIVLSGTGNLLFEGGNEISFSDELNLSSGTGYIRFNGNSIGLSSLSMTVTTQGGDLIFNSNRDNSGSGALFLEGNYNTNGGDLIMGGGTDPYTQNAVGYFSQGVRLAYAFVHLGGGSLLANGSGGSDGSNNVQGVAIQYSDIYAEGGNITMNGVGLLTQSCTNCEGVLFENANVSTTGSGSINLTGTGGSLVGTTNNNNGIRFFGSFGQTSSLTVENGDIVLNGSTTESAVSTLGISYTESILTATGNGNVVLASLKGINSGTGSTITTHAGDVTINAHAGTITTHAITTDTGDITLTSDDVDIQGDLTGTGTLTLQPYSNKDIRVQYLAGDYNLGSAEIAHFVDGWGQINIGDKDNTGQIFIGMSSWSDPIAFRNNHIKHVVGNITLTANGDDLTFINGWSELDADISTNNGDVTFTNTRPDAAVVGFDAGTVFGNNSTIASHGGDVLFNRLVHVGILNVNTANGDIQFNESIQSNFDSSDTSLSLNAGTGDISVAQVIEGNLNTGKFNLTATGNHLAFLGEIGATMGMGTVSLTSANTNITLPKITSIDRDITVNAGSGTITTADTLATGTGDLTLISNDIVIGNTVTGTGVLKLQTYDTNRIARVDSGIGDYELSATELGLLTDGWSHIYFGNSASTQITEIGITTWKDPVTFYGDTISIDGLTGTGNASFATVNGYINLYGNVTTAGGDIDFGSSYLSIYTDGRTLNSHGGDIGVNLHYGYNHGITLDAGMGDIAINGGPLNALSALTATAHGFTFDSNWGNTGYLGDVTITSATSLSMPTLIADGDVALNAGTGSITTQSISVGAHDLTLTADDLDIQDNLSGTGTLTLQPHSNNMLVRVDFYAGDFNLDAADLGHLTDGWNEIDIGSHNIGTALALNYSGNFKDPVRFLSDNLSIYGNLNATGNGAFTFDTNVLVRADLDITTAGGTVHFLNSVEFDTSGGRGLSIASNNGDITFDGYFKDFGGSNNYSILNAGIGNLSFGDVLDGAFSISAGARNITFAGDVGATNRLGIVSFSATNSMTLPSIYASNIHAFASGATADLTLGAGTTLDANGASNTMQLVAGRNLINNGATLSSAGRWIVYSSDATTGVDLDLLGSDYRRYGCTYGGSCTAGVTIPGTGNGLIFATRPTLTITPDMVASHLIYGDTVPGLVGYNYGATGYLFGDAGGLSGTLTGSTNYAQGSNVGTYQLNYSSGSLASSMGYQLTYANRSNAITVDKRTLSVSLIGTVTKVYDGTVAAILTAGNYLLTSIYGTDDVFINGEASRAYNNQHAGAGKNVSVTGLTLGGTKAGNYQLASNSATGGVGTITPKNIAVTANSITKIAGNADPLLTHTYGALATGDTSAIFSGALSRAVGEAIGTYGIFQGTLIATADYNIQYTSGSFQILDGVPTVDPTPVPALSRPSLPTTVIRVSQDASINQSPATSNTKSDSHGDGVSYAADYGATPTNQDLPTQTLEKDPAFSWMRGLLRVEPGLALRLGLQAAAVLD